jgi:transketolase
MRLTRDPVRSVTAADEPFTIGAAKLLREGDDIALIATGSQTVRAFEAAEMLAAQGVAASVLHVPTIKPLDEAAIRAVSEGTRCVLTCEEHSILGGLGGAVAEVLSAVGGVRVARLGLRDVDGESAPNDALLQKYGLTPEAIAGRARAELAVA